MKESNLKKRFAELADRSYVSGMFTFTDFLGIAEKSDLIMMENSISHVGYTLYGGYEDADRVVARFGKKDDLGYEVPFPIVCIHVKPLLKKFADDLTHRDFLGALMNLGIERWAIGDIKVNEKEAFIFCIDNIAEFIKDSLTRVKHTSMQCEIIEDANEIARAFAKEEPIVKQIIVSSLRVDAIISKVYNLSRSDSLNLFRAQKIYINGRLCENNSRIADSEDVINARGYGKFKISGKPKDTRKGRISIDISIW